jgi:hypothetical protein
MKAQTIGRAVGIGVRVAGRVAGQRIAANAQPATQQPVQPAPSTAISHATGKAAGKASKGLARGVGGFLRPFLRIGGILWLEVTGVFFFLFVLVFGRAAYRVRASALQGPDHQHFLGYGVFVGIFLYLSLSSFWRTRKK